MAEEHNKHMDAEQEEEGIKDGDILRGKCWMIIEISEKYVSGAGGELVDSFMDVKVSSNKGARLSVTAV